MALKRRRTDDYVDADAGEEEEKVIDITYIKCEVVMKYPTKIEYNFSTVPILLHPDATHLFTASDKLVEVIDLVHPEGSFSLECGNNGYGNFVGYDKKTDVLYVARNSFHALVYVVEISLLYNATRKPVYAKAGCFSGSCSGFKHTTNGVVMLMNNQPHILIPAEQVIDRLLFVTSRYIEKKDGDHNQPQPATWVSTGPSKRINYHDKFLCVAPRELISARQAIKRPHGVLVWSDDRKLLLVRSFDLVAELRNATNKIATSADDIEKQSRSLMIIVGKRPLFEHFLLKLLVKYGENMFSKST